MKLICEHLDQELSILKEAADDGKRSYFIEGIFLMGDRPNKNGRSYNSRILAKEVARYTKDLIENNRAYGELGHPQGPQINLDRVCMMIKSLRQEGSDFVGKAKITSTPHGDIVKGLLEDGANLGVSSRGMGSLKPVGGVMEVQDDFMLATAADIVADPSAQVAFVKGIMENVEWIYNEDYGWKAMEVAEAVKKHVHTISLEEMNNQKISIMEKFLASLSTKS
jgi:hypothetical protein